MHYMVAMVTGFLEKIDVLILWRFICVCGKFHTDTINQTVFGKEFVKLVWGKWKLFRASLSNCKEEAWKNQPFNGIRTCDFRDTAAMFQQLSYEATHWEGTRSINWVPLFP